MSFQHDQFETIELPRVKFPPRGLGRFQDFTSPVSSLATASTQNIQPVSLIQQATSQVSLIRRLLASQQFSKELQTRIEDHYCDFGGNPDKIEFSVLTDALNSALTFSTENPTEGEILAILGPTGAGKTTSVLKLAVQRQRAGKPLTVLSLDTRRAGGSAYLVESAQTFGIEVRCIERCRELVDCLSQWSGNGDVLIDTFGCPLYDHETHADLLDLLDCGFSIKKELLLPSVSSQSHLQEILSHYSSFQPEYVSITKLDEATAIGPWMSTVSKTNFAIRHFTTGQTIPEDLELGSASKIMGLIIERLRRNRGSKEE